MATADKLDLYKKHKAEYVTPKTPVLVKIKPAKYLAVTGKGAPGGDAFQSAIQALYSTAFTIKMTRKFAGQGDYAVCKLEGLWWTDGVNACDFLKTNPDDWRWKLMIRTPDFIDQADLDQARETLKKKGKDNVISAVVLETLDEGPCVQMLHMGPYDQERTTIALMMDFAKAEGYVFHGLHHEIYLSDPRRVPPERVRTILRHPVKRL